jgi:hypothetical protein
MDIIFRFYLCFCSIIYIILAFISLLFPFSASFVHFLFPLLQCLSKIWKDAMSGANAQHTNHHGASAQTQEEITHGDINVDGDTLVAIVQCFSYLIMLTKQSAEATDPDDNSSHTTTATTTRGRRKDGAGRNKTGGFGRREILCVALKEGRVFMEQFIRTSKVKYAYLFHYYIHRCTPLRSYCCSIVAAIHIAAALFRLLCDLCMYYVLLLFIMVVLSIRVCMPFSLQSSSS